MVNILIVDDSKLITTALKELITNKLNYNCAIAHSKKEAASLMLKYQGKFDVALLDLGLPDAPNGEVVDFITKFDIPIIILTGSEIESIEEKFRNKNVVDYVIKEGYYSLEYATNVVKRIVSNKKLKVLVVDDSKTSCEKIAKLLERYQLQVFKSFSGKQSLEILEENPDMSIVYLDYLMPDINGLDLTKEIRKTYSKDCTSIIALSGDADKKVISKFLKYGANDFIYKGFTEEEFFVRLNSNLEILELFQNVKDKANKDYLTGMFNRRYLFDVGSEIVERVNHRNDESLAIIVMDIDNFKTINDKWGHDTGDIALQEVNKVIAKYISSNSLVARLGGEEFCILLKGRGLDEIKRLLEALLLGFSNNIVHTQKCELSYTISMGVCINMNNNLTQMINHADEALYKAKQNGKNQVVYYES